MFVLLIVVAATLLVSMTCSLLEAVLYSTRRTELEAAVRAEKHPGQAHALLAMKRTIAAPLTSILILNTIANTAGASLAGSLVNDVLGTHWVLWFSILLTLAILFFSEIIPKTLGAVHWRALWPLVVMPLRFMQVLLYPAVRASLWLTRLLTGAQRSRSVTEEEILAMVQMGAREGELSDMESRMVVNIIGLENKSVKEIMTPRTVIFALEAQTPVEQAVDEAHTKGLNRIPVYEGSIEEIRGYVLLRDLSIRKAWSHPEAPISEFMKPVSFVPEAMNCITLLRRFLESREHMALVVDEYGGLSGLVTLEDIVETILGEEIVDETDLVVDMQEQARTKWRALLRKGKVKAEQFHD